MPDGANIGRQHNRRELYEVVDNHLIRSSSGSILVPIDPVRGSGASMACGRRVRAAAPAAAALLFCCTAYTVAPARADDIEDARAIVFSGRDVWLNGAFLNGGVLWSPTALDDSGLLFKFLLSGGLYRYDAGDLGGERVIGSEWMVQLLPGWHVKRGTFEAKVFMGPEFQQHHLSPDDPGNSLNGNKLGLRLSTELWDEPTDTTMIAADGSLSTVDGQYSARVGFGWKILDMFYSGPETQAYSADGYSQWRFGLHITSFKTGNAEWSAAGGWARDTNNRSSPYVRLGFMQRVGGD